ncbi:hypothetical protein [Niallia taxi]|uniref:hypothetical protein n=1 Tax=Niallia taxi TaxID=2499688 RepID=UPI00300B2D63
MKNKYYLHREVIVGDIVEATSNPFGVGDWIVGYHYSVVKLGHGYIVVTSDRLSKGKKEIVIDDGKYRVIECRLVKKPKETHVKVFKILGIPVGKKTTYIYD